jgi:hypothetical protein
MSVLAPMPEGVLVRESVALAESIVPAAILSHSFRTFLLAREFGRTRDIAFDEEGLMLAALFHDFGLVEGMRDRRRPFPEVGAKAVENFLSAKGELGRGQRLAQAIRYHMQVLPRWSRGPEAGLLQIGAWMDAAGLRRKAVGSEFIRLVEQSHPRGGFDTEFMGRLLKSTGTVCACFRTFFPRA